jgi:hypothetical protein
MKRVRKVLIAFAVLVIIGGVSGYLGRGWIRDRMHEASQPPLPPEETYEEQADGVNLSSVGDLEERNTPTHQPVNPSASFRAGPPTVLPAEQSAEDADADAVVIPSEKLLAVPFTSQAPFKEWDELHEEACEEASVIMVAGYYRGDRGAYEPDAAEAMILELAAFAEENGFDIDTTAEETAELAELFYPDLEADVAPMTGPESVKQYIAQGIPVILPAYGKALPNPNFRNGGPLYHMLVVRGYTEDRFITNDPGTRLGEKFLYTYDGLLDAVHDWNNGDVPGGERVMLIVRRR